MPAAGSCLVNIHGRNSSGSHINANGITITDIAANTETNINGIITITQSVAEQVKNSITIYFMDSSGNYQQGYVKQLRVERMSGASLIVDGSITADKLDVNDINAKKSLTIGALNTETQNKINNGNSALTKTNYYNREAKVGQSGTLVADKP